MQEKAKNMIVQGFKLFPMNGWFGTRCSRKILRIVGGELRLVQSALKGPAAAPVRRA